MTTGQTVNTKAHGTGTIIQAGTTTTLVDFNGTQKTILNFLLKTGEAKDTAAIKLARTKKKMQETKLSAKDIFGILINAKYKVENKEMALPIFAQIMEVADKKKHFASSVIETAMAKGTVTEKQAWATAYFAKNNGIIN